MTHLISPNWLAIAALPTLLLRLCGMALGFGVNVYAARLLSPQEYGLFGLAQVCVLFFICLVKYGQDTVLTRQLAASRAQNLSGHRTLLSQLAMGTFISSGLLIALVWTSEDWLSHTLLAQPHVSPVLTKMSLATLPAVLLLYLAGAFKAIHQSTLSTAFSGFVTYTALLLLMFTTQPNSALALSTLWLSSFWIACLLALTISGLKFGMRLTMPKPQSPLPLANHNLFLASLITLLIQQFGVVYLSHAVSSAQLAVYHVALRFALLFLALPFAINTVLAPHLSALYHEKKYTELKRLYQRSQTFMAFFAALLIALVGFWGQAALSIFGPSYTNATPVLWTLMIGISINLATGPSVNLLMMTGNDSAHRRFSLYSAVTIIILLVILVPRYGPIGAAISTSAAMSIQHLASWIAAQQILHRKVPGV